MAKIFNYTRPVKIGGYTTKNNKISIKCNDSYPWKTEDPILGFHSKIDLLPTYIDDFQSHDSYKFQGSHYQFHSPEELPFDQNQHFVSHTDSFLIFLIKPEILKLGETLMNYDVEKYN